MLSVVVLCYRSEEKIISFLDKLQSILQEERIKYELVLVGNYYETQNDKTPEIIKNYSKRFENIVTVTKKKEGGMGWDAISGFDNCSGDSIAFIDGDGQFPSSDIIRIYNNNDFYTKMNILHLNDDCLD